MSKNDYLSEQEVAEWLHIKKSTLQKFRQLGRKHPPFIKMGGIILFPKKEFELWLKNQPLRTEMRAG